MRFKPIVATPVALITFALILLHLGLLSPAFNPGSSRSVHAYATFFSTRVDNDTADDPYFTATRVLAYQLLHRPLTRTRRNIPFLVLVPPHVSQRKRNMLAEEGATVIGVDTLEPSSWHPSPGQARWIDQFTKLRLFELTDYERIAYMDNDMLVARPLDDIWDEEEVINPKATVLDDTKTQLDEAPLPASYVIAGVTDNEGPGNHHPVPVTSTSRLNGGFFVLQPSKGLFEYYKSILEQRGRFDNGMMEMGLLNYAHRLDGNMPWVPLIPGKWSNNWPALRDMELGSATLHDKFWDKGNRGWIEPELVEMWWRVQGQMEGHWQRAREKTVEYL